MFSLECRVVLEPCAQINLVKSNLFLCLDTILCYDLYLLDLCYECLSAILIMIPFCRREDRGPGGARNLVINA